MSGLGLFKGGSRSRDPPQFRTSFDFSSYVSDTIEEDEETNEDFAENESTTTMQSSIAIPEEILMPEDRVKGVMKQLKYAVKTGASIEQVVDALVAIQKLANTTYGVRAELGERGVCEGVATLFERHLTNARIVTEVLKGLSFMLLSDNENKVRVSKLGVSKFTVEAMHVHAEDPDILELCCKLIVDLGNGKFVAMLEEDYRRKELERDLRSRAMKRSTLTPSRIANMSASAAATATKALEELKTLEEAAQDSKLATARSTATAESKHESAGTRGSPQDKEGAKPDDCTQNEAVWDNRLDLCAAGACEAVVALLSNLVVVALTPTEHRGSLQDHRTSSSAFSASSLAGLPSIFEDEDVVVAACQAVASLAANPVCCRRFAKDGRLARCLSTLLLHFKHWHLMGAAAWAMVVLCADSKAGNKERFGAARAADNLSRGLIELCTNHADYGQVPGFHRLLELYVWALLNLVIANAHNKETLRATERVPLLEQLLSAPWPKPGVKEKVRQILKHMSLP